MDCEKFRDMLDNYENLTEEERLMLTKHTTECAECRAELDFMNAILKVTKSLPEIKPKSDFIESLNRRIDKESRRKPMFIGIDWKHYGSVAACLLLAVVAGLNGKSLVGRMTDNGDGVISETVVTTGGEKTPEYTAKLPELSDTAVPNTVFEQENITMPSSKIRKNQTDLSDMVIDNSNYVPKAPAVTSRPTPTPAVEREQTVKDNNSRAVNNVSATPTPSTVPYTIEKNRYRIPDESTGEAVVANEPQEQKDNGYSLKTNDKDVVAMNNSASSRSVNNEIESAIPGSTVVIYSENESKAKEIISNYIVGTYGTYYMTTADKFDQMFEEFDKEGISYEKYVNSSSDKISFRLVIL